VAGYSATCPHGAPAGPLVAGAVLLGARQPDGPLGPFYVSLAGGVEGGREGIAAFLLAATRAIGRDAAVGRALQPLTLTFFLPAGGAGGAAPCVIALRRPEQPTFFELQPPPPTIVPQGGWGAGAQT
jgi:hypothetical protein